MDRIRRVGCSAILSELAKKGMSEGGDEERVDSMNVVPDTVVGRKEEARKESEGKTTEWEEDEAKTPIEANDPLLKSVRVEVSDVKGWETMDSSVCELVIASKCCNEAEVKDVNLGRFVSLKVFEVGDECFENVEEVKLIGLNRLERVVIGKNSFTKQKDWFGNDPNRHFYLKNCERLRELKMGRYSFSDYAVCEIENVPSLEVIEMGDLNRWSHNFWYASLELKSDSHRMK